MTENAPNGNYIDEVEFDRLIQTDPELAAAFNNLLSDNLKDKSVLTDATTSKEQFEALIKTDPEVAEVANAMRKLAETPGLLEAALAQIEIQELLNDPNFQKALAELDAGNFVDITPEH